MSPQGGRLASGPGVRIAATLLVTVGDASTFSHAGHLASYTGLSPATKSSGSSIQGEHAPRRGNRQLNAVHVRRAARSAFPRYYDRHRAAGKTHTPALLRLARRRIAVLFAMLRNGAFYSVAGSTGHDWPTMTAGDRAAFDPVSAPLFGAVFAQLVIGVLAVLAITSEYGTGLIRTTFATTPQRRKVLLAKVTVTTAVALGAGTAILGLAFGLSQAMMANGHGGVSLADPGVFRGMAYAVLYLMLITVLGTSLGAITRATAGGIAVLFTLVFLVPQVLDHLPQNLRHDLMRFGLQRAATSAVSLRPQVNTFSPTTSILVCTAYAVVAFVLALFLIGHRDA